MGKAVAFAHLFHACVELGAQLLVANLRHNARQRAFRVNAACRERGKRRHGARKRAGVGNPRGEWQHVEHARDRGGLLAEVRQTRPDQEHERHDEHDDDGDVGHRLRGRSVGKRRRVDLPGHAVVDVLENGQHLQGEHEQHERHEHEQDHGVEQGRAHAVLEALLVQVVVSQREHGLFEPAGLGRNVRHLARVRGERPAFLHGFRQGGAFVHLGDDAFEYLLQGAGAAVLRYEPDGLVGLDARLVHHAHVLAEQGDLFGPELLCQELPLFFEATVCRGYCIATGRSVGVESG